MIYVINKLSVMKNIKKIEWKKISSVKQYIPTTGLTITY